MTNKTPLQELIEWIDKLHYTGVPFVSEIKAKANELKAKEKNIIVDAYDEGYNDASELDGRNENYFNQTFIQ